MTLKENGLQTWKSRHLFVCLRLCLKKRKQPDRTFNTPYIKDKTGEVDIIQFYMFYLKTKHSCITINISQFYNNYHIELNIRNK